MRDGIVDGRSVNNGVRGGREEQESGNGPRGGSSSHPGSPRWVPKAPPSPETRHASIVPWTLSPACLAAPSSRQ